MLTRLYFHLFIKYSHNSCVFQINNSANYKITICWVLRRLFKIEIWDTGESEEFKKNDCNSWLYV